MVTPVSKPVFLSDNLEKKISTKFENQSFENKLEREIASLSYSCEIASQTIAKMVQEINESCQLKQQIEVEIDYMSNFDNYLKDVYGGLHQNIMVSKRRSAEKKEKIEEVSQVQVN